MPAPNRRCIFSMIHPDCKLIGIPLPDPERRVKRVFLIGHGPVNLAGIRRLVVNLQDDKLSFRRRLLKAAQAPEYRLEIIANAAKIAETI